MRIAATALFAVLAAQAKGPVQQNESVPLTVCMQAQADFTMAMRARGIAAKMFAEIGVKIAWHDMSGCPAQSIVISLSEQTSESFHPGALAYAMPYEGTHIVLFYDRIAATGYALRPHLMAHVMVHEITHVLEGVAHHSEEGVMKAHWSQQDFDQMILRCLSFTREDAEMIHDGMLARTARLYVAKPAPVAR